MTFYLHRKHNYSKAGASAPTSSPSGQTAPLTSRQANNSGDAISDLGYGPGSQASFFKGSQASFFLAAPAVASGGIRSTQKLNKHAMNAHSKGPLAVAQLVRSNGDAEDVAEKQQRAREEQERIAKEEQEKRAKEEQERRRNLPRSQLEPPVCKYQPKHKLVSPRGAAPNLRFDRSVPLLELLDVHQIETGYDWRLMDPKKWLEVKYAISKSDLVSSRTVFPAQSTLLEVDEEILSSRERCAKIWYNLTACVLLGTRQAYEAGGYPLLKPAQQTIVNSPRYRNVGLPSAGKALNLKFLCQTAARNRVDMPAVSFGIPKAPPVVTCALGPLDAVMRAEQICSAELGGNKNSMPPMILAIDGEMCYLQGNMNANKNTRGRPAAHAARPLMNEQPTVKDLFLRTSSQAFIGEAERRLALNDSEPLRTHLSSADDPYVLYCNDVELLREGVQAGYGFLENPLSFDAIMYTMATARPMTTKARDSPEPLEAVDKPKHDQAVWLGFQVKEKTEDYVMKEDEQSFYQRLTLVVESAIGESQQSLAHLNQPPSPGTRRGSKRSAGMEKSALPILVLALPGCLNGKGHPVGGVSRLLKGLRERWAEQFCAIVVACGTDDHLCKQVDSHINRDFYELDDLPGAIEGVNWSPLLKKMLANQSVSTRWGKAMKQADQDDKRRGSKLKRAGTGWAAKDEPTDGKKQFKRAGTGKPTDLGRIDDDDDETPSNDAAKNEPPPKFSIMDKTTEQTLAIVGTFETKEHEKDQSVEIKRRAQAWAESKLTKQLQQLTEAFTSRNPSSNKKGEFKDFNAQYNQSVAHSVPSSYGAQQGTLMHSVNHSKHAELNISMGR